MATTKTKKKQATTKRRFSTHVTAPSGERIYVSASSKAALEAKVVQLKLEIGAGVDVGDETTFEEYAQAWLRAYKQNRMRENSFGTLESNYRNHVLPYFKDMKLKDIKPIHVQMFLGQLTGYSKSVQAKCLQIFSGIMRTAADNGLIVKSPVTSDTKIVGSEPKEEMEPLTQEQARRLLAAVKDTRAYLFCFLALSTGLRRSEILGLMWEDIDLKTGQLTVRHSKTFPPNKNDAPVTMYLKSESAHRTIPLHPALTAYLEQERSRTDSPYVVSMANGESLTKSSFRKLWNIVEVRTATEERPLGTTVGGGRAGPIPVMLDFECHPHLLRHTCITQWVESGMDFKEVQYLAGHSSLEMTLGVYSHYRRKSNAAETAARVSAANAYLAS